MLISKKISDFLVFETESVFRALEKINSNRHRLIFIVSESGVLQGSLSDGDFRRWITTTPNFDLQLEVREVMHTNVKFLSINAKRELIENSFSKVISLIPLVDSSKRLVAVAFKGEVGLSISATLISENSPSYIIAEIGNNHNGSVDRAKQLVDHAINAGANCAKFQMRHIESLYGDVADEDSSASSDLGVQYTRDLLNKFQLSDAALIAVFDYCYECGITPLCTPWDLKSLEVLENYGMEAYKVASADLTNHQLLHSLAQTGKPLLCSTGMSTESEIRSTVEFLKREGANFLMLHCNSTYPTPFKDVNLSYLSRLREITGSIVGYSGHERGFAIPVAAVAMGARVIEKHLTVDRTLEGSDHKVSLLPDEFKIMVEMIRNVEDSLGQKAERTVSQGEMINRENLAKSLVATKLISIGETITAGMLAVKSPGQGLQPMYSGQLIGRAAMREIKAGSYFYDADLQSEVVKPRDYFFKRPFGIPVRYHDYKCLTEQTNLDFVEFHLSYKDLELDPKQFFSKDQQIGFAVHAPELFSGDHILDFAAEDVRYRAHSLTELNRVCDVARDLKNYFPRTERPVVVLNVGGFTQLSFITSAENKETMYERVASCLTSIDESGIEILIQSMPPFPWHFGGQSYHNLFVSPSEIAEFCARYNRRICLDVSHSMMACSYYGWSLSDFIKTVGRFVGHLHIVDAVGVDGEGVQIGRGDVDFGNLAIELEKYSPCVSFIPEVWQGHKNTGEGFWCALEFLERYFGDSAVLRQ